MNSARRFSLAALAAAAACALPGCRADAPPEAAQRNVFRPAFGFGVDMPGGWTVRDLDGDVVLEAVAVRRAEPAAGRPRSTPVIQVLVIERDAVTLEGWADDAIADAQNLDGALAVVRREPARLADGRAALRVDLENPRGVEPQIQRMLLTLGEGRAYALLATAAQSQWPGIEEAVARCFGSLVIW